MVVLNVKRGEKFLFLYETTLDAKVDVVLSDLCVLINGRLKILRITDALTSLANHGIAKPPNFRGLLEDQVRELKLKNEDAEICEPVGGFDDNPDPVEFRIGRSPTSTFKQLLMDAVKDAEVLVKNAQHKLTHQDISKLLKDLGDAVKTVYPMGLPEYEPVRMELENREILSECLNSELTKVADPHDTKLWFASKELLVGACLKEFLGNNEKSKVTIKVASKKAGQPCREPLISEQDQRLLMMHSARRREELEKLARDADDSYLDAPWADQHSLKRKVLGLDNISWRP